MFEDGKNAKYRKKERYELSVASITNTLNMIYRMYLHGLLWSFACFADQNVIFTPEKRTKKRKWEYILICLCVFTGFSIILSLIEAICAKGMRVSQPQCQIEESNVCL